MEKRLGFPQNLLVCAYGEKYETMELTEDQEAGLEYVLSLLSDNAKKVLKYRYQSSEKLTMQDIADKIGTSRQCVSLQNEKILGKLNHPQNKAYIVYGMKGLQEDGKDSIASLGLSVRTYNSLFMAHIERVDQIPSEEKLRKIRGIGDKAVVEIMEACKRVRGERPLEKVLVERYTANEYTMDQLRQIFNKKMRNSLKKGLTVEFVSQKPMYNEENQIVGVTTDFPAELNVYKYR